MDAETVVSLAFGLTVLAFLWNLHRNLGLLRKEFGRDISDLRDRVSRVEERVSSIESRVARVEGMLAGAGLKVAPEPASG